MGKEGTVVRRITKVGGGLLAVTVAVWSGVHPGEAKTAKSVSAADPATIAVRHAQALAASRVEEWARLDLGCLARERAAGHKPTLPTPGRAQQCWDDTMRAQYAMAKDEPETGVLGPGGRGRGFGLLAPTHRGADKWKTYPPGIFLSPAVVRPAPDTVPVVTRQTVSPSRPVSLTQGDGKLLNVPGTMVELRVHYVDPFTAPLALAPDQVWWASGTSRRYPPVHSVVIRVVVVTGLQRAGYPSDVAVVNEALTETPQIAATSYGMQATEESLQPSVRGQFVLGSARWWTKELAKDTYATAVKQVVHLSDPKERRRRLQGLLQVDPTDAHVNGLLGDLEFEAFLREGLTKGGITAQDEDLKLRLAELYWNFQAQTWRQELTEVSQGHSAAAESFYAAFRALEAAIVGGEDTLERRRRLGLLNRWNNDVDNALVQHEALLGDVPKDEPTARGRSLSDIAWDRIQWVSWNRRYDHPWLAQAQTEAKEALELATSTLDRLAASEALLMAEALSFTRTPASLEARYQTVKQHHDRLPRVTGLWPYLVGNDSVKALLPEGERVTVPTPTRSDEVLNVEVHARPPRQDIIRRWDFDQDGRLPAGFTHVSVGANGADPWLVQKDDAAASPPNVLHYTGACQGEACLSMLSGEALEFAFPDATVQINVTEQSEDGGAGIVMWERGGPTAYAVVLNPVAKQVKFYRIRDGKSEVIATEAVKLQGHQWHSLRLQRVNYAHVSRPRLAAYVDGRQVAITPEDVIPMIERVGLIVRGKTTVSFDSLHLVDMVTNRPMSAPAAY